MLTGWGVVVPVGTGAGAAGLLADRMPVVLAVPVGNSCDWMPASIAEGFIISGAGKLPTGPPGTTVPSAVMFPCPSVEIPPRARSGRTIASIASPHSRWARQGTPRSATGPSRTPGTMPDLVSLPLPWRLSVGQASPRRRILAYTKGSEKCSSFRHHVDHHQASHNEAGYKQGRRSHRGQGRTDGAGRRGDAGNRRVSSDTTSGSLAMGSR